MKSKKPGLEHISKTTDQIVEDLRSKHSPMRILYESPNSRIRIIEVPAPDVDLGNLKGDSYNPEANPEIDSKTLAEQEHEFEDAVNREGVYGYILQCWNPAPGVGWETVDSCFGFVGSYSPDDRSGLFNHYIVAEMLETAKGLDK